jgi:hypothetical protein
VAPLQSKKNTDCRAFGKSVLKRIWEHEGEDETKGRKRAVLLGGS